MTAEQHQVEVEGLTVAVDRGWTVAFDRLPPWSIALDGVVDGPAIDGTGHRFSFDHHAGCIRLVTSATCRQVLDALLLGLDPSPYRVLVNDVDGDTTLAVALLCRPLAARNVRIRQLVDVVATADAHGPSYPLADQGLFQWFVHAMAPEREARRTGAYGSCDLAALLVDTVERVFGLFDELVSDDMRTLPIGTGPSMPVRYTVLHRGKGWVLVQSTDAVAVQLYRDGYDRWVAARPLDDGSHVYTVAKRSDLVDGFPVGPSDQPGTILHRLAEVEPGWGGSSTVGGAPRRPDGSRSRLPPAQVAALVDEVLSGAGG